MASKTTTTGMETSGWRARQALRAFITVITGCVIAAGCATEPRPTAQNRTVILIDTSLTFTRRFSESVSKTKSLLEQMSKAKLHRWEKGNDHIAIVSVDAIPEALWEGSLAELRAVDTDSLVSKLTARTDYARCTDVGAAF